MQFIYFKFKKWHFSWLKLLIKLLAEITVLRKTFAIWLCNSAYLISSKRFSYGVNKLIKLLGTGNMILLVLCKKFVIIYEIHKKLSGHRQCQIR